MKTFISYIYSQDIEHITIRQYNEETEPQFQQYYFPFIIPKNNKLLNVFYFYIIN